MSKTTILLAVAALLLPGVALGGAATRFEDPEDPAFPGSVDIRALTVSNDAQNLYVTMTLRDLSNPDPVDASTYRLLYLVEWRFQGIVTSVRFDVSGYESTHRGLGYGPMAFVPGVPFVGGGLVTGPGSIVYGSQGSRYFHNDGIEVLLNQAENTLTFTIPLVMTLTRQTGTEEDLTEVAQVGKRIDFVRVMTGTYGLVKTDTVANGGSYTLK